MKPMNSREFSKWTDKKKKKESEVTQLCPTLCNPIDYSLPDSSVHGILQARILEWVAISFSRGCSQPRDWTWVSHIAGRRFTLWATREAAAAKSLQSWPTLCNPIDGSPPGSAIPGILQARILEWVAISFSRGCSQPRDWTRVSCVASRLTIWGTRKAPPSLGAFQFLPSFYKCVFYK